LQQVLFEQPEQQHLLEQLHLEQKVELKKSALKLN
jgi:hypothetical protein